MLECHVTVGQYKPAAFFVYNPVITVLGRAEEEIQFSRIATDCGSGCVPELDFSDVHCVDQVVPNSHLSHNPPMTISRCVKVSGVAEIRNALFNLSTWIKIQLETKCIQDSSLSEVRKSCPSVIYEDPNGNLRA